MEKTLEPAVTSNTIPLPVVQPSSLAPGKTGVNSSDPHEIRRCEHILLATGFISQNAAKREYAQLSQVRFDSYALNSELMALVGAPLTPEAVSRAREIIYDSISKFRYREPSVEGFTIATPGLELLTPELINDLQLQFVSLNDEIARFCAQHKLRRVGLLGTEWDMLETGPLASALQRRRIAVYVPSDAKVRQMLSYCATQNLHGSIYYQKPQTASDFCLTAIESIPRLDELDALIICNTEFRWLAQSIANRYSFRLAYDNLSPAQNSKRMLIDATRLHWDIMKDFIARE